jgi:hypothetical protein
VLAESGDIPSKSSDCLHAGFTVRDSQDFEHRPLHRSRLPHSAISLLPFADAANPGGRSVAVGLVDDGPLAPVGSPQSRQRMQRRHQRDFLPHGIDSLIEFHFAHHTLQSAGPTFCRPVRKRARAEHTSSREFVVRRLGHGHFGGKNGPKSGRSSPHTSQNCWFHRPMAVTPWPNLADAC